MTPISPVRRAPRGFTLIELLVVIAIIALLAAILFPVFAKAREKARQTACLSNMSQIAKALEMYKQDYEGYFPPSQTGAAATLVSWPSLILTYLGSPDVFVCPSASDKVFAPDAINVANTTANFQYAGITDSKYPSAFGNYTGDGSLVAGCTASNIQCVPRLSYGRNLIPDTAAGWSTTGFKTTTNHKQGFVTSGTTVSVNESQIEAPASTIHIMDAMTGTASGDPRSQGNSIRGITAENRTDHYTTETASKVAYRHTGGFNAIYGDGHAHWNVYGRTKACDWSIQDDTCP